MIARVRAEMGSELKAALDALRAERRDAAITTELGKSAGRIEEIAARLQRADAKLIASRPSIRGRPACRIEALPCPTAADAVGWHQG